MTDTEKLEQMLDQIAVMYRELDNMDINQRMAMTRLMGAASHISAAIRQAQINENVDFQATVEE